MASTVAAPVRADDDEDPSAWQEVRESTSFNYEFALRYWKVRTVNPLTDETTNEDFYDLPQRLYVTTATGPLSFGVQVDAIAALPRFEAQLFADDAPPHAFRTGTVVAEKIFARFTPSDDLIEVGDFYKSIGRGIALSTIRNVDIDQDTTLQGGSAELYFGPIQAHAFGGITNPQTVSLTLRNRLTYEVKDRIVGAAVIGEGGPVIVGAHMVNYFYDPEASRQTELRHRTFEVERANVFGVTVNAPDIAGRFDFYAEGNGVRYRAMDPFDDLRTRLINGHALYGSLTGYFGPLSAQIEGKSYIEFEAINLRAGLQFQPYEYVTPPPLEKENVVTADSSHAVNSSHINGARANVAYTRGTLTYRLTYQFAQDLGRSNVDLNEWINHVIGAIEYRNSGRFAQISTGYRIEPRTRHPERMDRLFHLDADVLFPLGGERTIESKLLVYRSHVLDPVPDPGSGGATNVFNSELTLSFRPRTRYGLTVYLDDTNDPQAAGLQPGGSTGNLGRGRYLAGEIDFRPTPNGVLRLFVGAQKGGLKCSGGTCRVLPPFEGVRFEGALRF